MNFIHAGNDPNNGLYLRLVSDCGRVEIGVYRVLFGYRVRAGFSDTGYYHIDWCAGCDGNTLRFLYATIRNILESREYSSSLFVGIPGSSERKPAYNDPEFVGAITALTSGEIDVSPEGFENYKEFDEIVRHRGYDDFISNHNTQPKEHNNGT